MRTVVIGGTAGIGLEVVRARAARGDEVVLTGRDRERSAEVARSVDGDVSGLAVDLNDTHGLADALAGVGSVDRLVIAAIERDQNSVADFDVDRATRLAVLKLVGYTEVVHTLLPRMNEDSSMVLFGGRAKDRPYPGSVTVSTVNGGVVGLVNALALEVAPIRVNALHPGIVGDSPVLVRKAGRRPRRLRLADPDRPTRHDGRHRRRGRLPAGEPRRQRAPTCTSTAGGWSREHPIRMLAALRFERGPQRMNTDPLRVAVVGTGRMGGAMAGRIAAAGHPLTVWNRSRDKAEAVAAALPGVIVADTPRAAAEATDVVVVSLADDAALLATYRGEDGLVAGLRPGVVVAETSTVAPETIRRLGGEVAAAGAALTDTPVSGSVSSIEAGAVLVMAGGDADAVERARPVLESFAKRTITLGPLGSGSTMKLAVNALVFGLNQALAEALVLAERAGVERHLAFEVFADSAAGAPFVAYKRAAFEDPDSAPVAFALDLVAKDLDLASALAAEVGTPVPQLEINRRVVGEAIAAGLGDADLSAVARHLRG